MTNVFNITELGADPNGKTDSTFAIQTAINKAEKVKGTVIVPPGKYLCGELQMKQSVCLCGYNGWGYRDIGGSVLVFNGSNASCLINLTNANGCTVKSLQLLGNNKGEHVNGIMINNKLYNGNGATFFDGYETDFHEDSVVIDDCQVRDFSGDGVHLNKAFAFTIRNSHFILNKGNGIYLDGWDGWITNSIISFNGSYAFYSDKVASALTITGNRIEWNRSGGLYFTNGNSNIINSNAFDRSMGPAIDLSGKCEYRSDFVINGNNFNRSGKPQKHGDFKDKYLSSHIYIKNTQNVSVCGNIMKLGADDGGGGKVSPNYALVYENSKELVLSGNAMYNAAVIKNIVCLDKGDK